MPMGEYAEKAYLDYSMYVVLDRALPFVGDGLKPVFFRNCYRIPHGVSDRLLGCPPEHVDPGNVNDPFERQFA